MTRSTDLCVCAPQSTDVYVNTDEGWESKDRDPQGKLQWSASAFPSGLPAFIKRLHGQQLKFGIYGAAS